MGLDRRCEGVYPRKPDLFSDLNRPIRKLAVAFVRVHLRRLNACLFRLIRTSSPDLEAKRGWDQAEDAVAPEDYDYQVVSHPLKALF